MSVLAVVVQEKDLAGLLPWGCEFASGDDAGLVLVEPVLGPRQEPVQLDLTAAEPEPLVAHILELQATTEPPRGADGELRSLPQLRAFRVQGPDLVAAILELVDDLDGQLLIVAKHERLRGAGADEALVRQLFRQSPCATLLLRAAPESRMRRRRLLVPTAGGPNAEAALRWADRMARHADAQVTALFVEPPIGEDPELVGERLLETAIADANLEDSEHIERRVEVAEGVPEAIRAIAEEDYDMVLIGASYQGFVRQMLFGTLPQHLMEGEDAVAVGVLRARKRLVSRLVETLEGWFSRRLPQLARDERVALFETLQSRSRWDVDFLLLMALSTAIAALGLIQSSAAVVIGAMLVAPLMTPLLSAGLALVQGNSPLLRTASRSLTLGFLTAVGIGFVLGLIAPMPALTPELLARGAPTLLDLGVAFLSGLAAAYASGRPALSAALPGVAIAAALVPPIATVGVSLAHGAGRNALGAALLFSTNVVAIVLGAAVCLYALGVRSGPRGSRVPLWVRRVVLALLFAVALLAIPLTSVLVSSLQSKVEAPFAVLQLESALQQRLTEWPGVEFESLRVVQRAPMTLEIRVAAAAPPGPELARELAETASLVLENPVRIRLVETLVVYGEAADVAPHPTDATSDPLAVAPAQEPSLPPEAETESPTSTVD